MFCISLSCKGYFSFMIFAVCLCVCMFTLQAACVQMTVVCIRLQWMSFLLLLPVQMQSNPRENRAMVFVQVWCILFCILFSMQLNWAQLICTLFFNSIAHRTNCVIFFSGMSHMVYFNLAICAGMIVTEINAIHIVYLTTQLHAKLDALCNLLLVSSVFFPRVCKAGCNVIE